MWSALTRVGVVLATSAMLTSGMVLAPPSSAAPFLGLFGDGDDAPADCSGSTCDGGNGGLIFGNGGDGANGGNGGNGGFLFGNGGKGADGSQGGTLEPTFFPGNGGNAGLFGNGGNGGKGFDAVYLPDGGIGPDPKAKITAQPGGNGGNGGFFSGNGGDGGDGGSDLNTLNWNFSYTDGGNGGKGGNAGILSGKGGNGGNGGNAGSNIGEVRPGTGGSGGSGSRNGSAGTDGQNGSVINLPASVKLRTAAKAGIANQTRSSVKTGASRSGRP